MKTPGCENFNFLSVISNIECVNILPFVTVFLLTMYITGKWDYVSSQNREETWVIQAPLYFINLFL